MDIELYELMFQGRHTINGATKRFNIERKNYLIANNLDPKDFMFYGLLEGGITFYNKHFKNLWTITKKGHTSPTKVKVSPN